MNQFNGAIAGEVYNCSLCSEICTTEEDLIAHVVKVHWIPPKRRCEGCCGPQVIKIFRGYGCAKSCVFPAGALEEVAVTSYPPQSQTQKSVSNTPKECMGTPTLQAGEYAEIVTSSEEPAAGKLSEGSRENDSGSGNIADDISVSQLSVNALMSLSDYQPKTEPVDSSGEVNTPPSTPDLHDERSLGYNLNPPSGTGAAWPVLPPPPYMPPARRGSVPPVCRECELTFKRKDQLVAHQFYVHGIVKHSCWICSKEYPSAFNVRRHVALKHRDPSEIGRCYVLNCGRHFGLRGEKLLSEHTNLSHRGKLECMYCGADTGSLQSLVCHVGVRHPIEVGVHLTPVSRGRRPAGGLPMVTTTGSRVE